MTGGLRVGMLGAVLAAVAMPTPSFAEPNAFGPGEQSTYRVTHLGVSVGTLQLTVGSEMTWRGRTALPIVVLARTQGLFDLYRIRDRFVSYWDANEDQCLGSELFSDEGRRRSRQRIELDSRSGKATVSKQREGEAPNTNSLDVQPGVFDIVSATFALRNQPLDVGRSVDLAVFTGRKTFILRATVEGRETLDTAMGRREAFRLRVQTGFTGKFISKQDLIAWLTADDGHVPLRIDAEFVLGTLRAELTDYKAGRSRDRLGAGAAGAGSGGLRR